MASIGPMYRQAGFSSAGEYEQYQKMQAMQLQQQQEALRQSKIAADALNAQMNPPPPDPISGREYQQLQQQLLASTRASGQVAPNFRPAKEGEKQGQPGYDAYMQERGQYYSNLRQEIAAGTSQYRYLNSGEANADVRKYLDQYTAKGLQTAELEGKVGLSAPSAAGFNQQYAGAYSGGGGAVNTGGGLPSLGGAPQQGGGGSVDTSGNLPGLGGSDPGPAGGGQAQPYPPTDGGQQVNIQPFPYTGGTAPQTGGALPPATGGGGTAFGGYTQTGGGTGNGYPAPGTMVPTSYSIAGAAGGYDTLETAVGESKDIYGNIIPHQAGLVNQYSGESQAAQQQMQDTANQYGQREQDLGGMLQGYGDYERQQIEAKRVQAIEAKKQELINRGATNQSSYESAMRSVNQTAGDQLSQYEDQLTRRKMDYMAMLSGDRLQAQSAAADFSAGQAAQRFTAAQTPVQSMSDLAALLAQQRDSAANRAAQLSVSQQDIGLEYAKLAESSRQATADRTLMQMQMGQQSALGYADLASQYAAQRLASSTDKAVARINTPRLPTVRYN